MTEQHQLPQRPFFSCDEDGFSVVDGELMRQELGRGSVVPLFTLRVGEDNIFERRPRRVAAHEGMVVTVACDDDTTVELDFEAGTARKRTPAGEWLYRGGIDEGNNGKGFIQAY